MFSEVHLKHEINNSLDVEYHHSMTEASSVLAEREFFRPLDQSLMTEEGNTRRYQTLPNNTKDETMKEEFISQLEDLKPKKRGRKSKVSVGLVDETARTDISTNVHTGISTNLHTDNSTNVYSDNSTNVQKDISTNAYSDHSSEVYLDSSYGAIQTDQKKRKFDENPELLDQKPEGIISIYF